MNCKTEMPWGNMICAFSFKPRNPPTASGLLALWCSVLDNLAPQGSARITVEGDLDPAVAEFATQGPLQIVLPKSYQGEGGQTMGYKAKNKNPTHTKVLRLPAKMQVIF